VQAKGLTTLKLFTNEKGMAKLEIGLCRGKKLMTIKKKSKILNVT
jgi:tmRNA-binding protein